MVPGSKSGMNIGAEFEQTAVDFAGVLAHEGQQFSEKYFWHQTEDKYVVLLAEFFLRRSNRTTVSRYLPAFLTAYPEPQSLILADPDDVVEAAAWAGFRSRVLCLPAILKEFYSRDDWNADSLLELPYIGEYAANGIALYVLGQPSLPVDGNVRRVVSRYFGVIEPDLTELLERLKVFLLDTGATELLKSAHMGMLALGWNACRVNPDCSECPLARSCVHSRTDGVS